MPAPDFYTPNIGDRVKLVSIEEYIARGVGDHVWSWFRVVEILTALDDSPYPVLVKLQLTNGPADVEGVTIIVPPAEKEAVGYRQVISPPLGWEPVYTIYTYGKKQTEMLQSWLDDGRGIKVRQSMDLGCAGRQSFTPGDNDANHWSMKAIEIVKDPDRIKIVDRRIERFQQAMKNCAFARSMDALAEISGKMEGELKALADARVIEIKTNPRIKIVKTGCGVIQRTAKGSPPNGFADFAYVAYAAHDNNKDEIGYDLIFPERSRMNEKAFRRFQSHVAFRFHAGYNKDWYVAGYTMDRSNVHLREWSLDEDIDLHDKKPYARRAVRLADWCSEMTI